ncbi:dihydroorotate dehydrogenase B, electron transfer subunit [mine drainage metagenome]|uniref:Dihydroorotate dehydrogenase B, electron transfer subunit n=1 Tax=mine drainage metagenome TaxID=410659 RepID=A0A1J5RM61_9ZZZZ
MMDNSLKLAHGLGVADLYQRDGLVRLDAEFLRQLDQTDAPLAARLLEARARPEELSRGDESELFLALAPVVDAFVAALFCAGGENKALRRRQEELEVLFECKRKFVQRVALRRIEPGKVADVDGAALRLALAGHLDEPQDELGFARSVMAWMADEAAHAEPLAAAARYAAWASYTAAGRRAHGHGVLFRTTQKRGPLERVATASESGQGITWLKAPADQALRQRRGFALSDPGCDLAGGISEIKYCILCHHQGKDSCSTGMREPAGGFKKNALGVAQVGCPLEERISEMHEARGEGYAIAALGIICVDNPMTAGTGHRICNDCMAACIYQNKNHEPVNIPEAETRTLKDVLALPWGFEIYSLLTRWNPFNIRRPIPRPASGRTVLVVGMGPAGYTLAHHLMNDGHAVIGIDGLKIEPLAASLCGRDADGRRVPFAPVHDAEELHEELEARVNAGFGGVAEYGITVRWDKNFLKVIRLLLERRAEFSLYGGIRFGGTLSVESAFALGVDHIALCLGAGKPTVLDIDHGLARGVRQASDFLMALQLTGAARETTLANLQVRLPVLVIGGGLTAIDTCTEALAYYPVQVEKFLGRYERLCAERGEASVRAAWSPEEAEVADEFIGHASALRAERMLALKEQRPADLIGLLEGWGGATIVYRRRMVESPAYRNHEEIVKALEEGIRFAEQLTPLAVEVDAHGHASGLRVRAGDGTETTLAARAILVAAGTVPNTVLAREHGGFELDGKFFQAHDEDGTPITPERCSKPAALQLLARIMADGRSVSFFGDLHPSFAGNVVSAMASAKQGYPVVSRMLARAPQQSTTPAALVAKLDDSLRARVVSVAELAPNIVEVVVRAPEAARAFRPGQFFRLQNYEAHARQVRGTQLAMEGLALTGAWVDREAGLVSVIVLEMGGSSSLCRRLQPNDPVVLMGPTGEPTEIPDNETVLLAGGGLGNAVLFSIGQAMRAAAGTRVLYFAAYRNAADRFKLEEIEAAADVVVWCTDQGPAPAPRRPQDKAFVGNVVEAMRAYAEGGLGATSIAMNEVDRVIAIGSDRMMAAVAAARHAVLKPHLKPGHKALASINSPMQCMMKEVCGQCLQTHRDPVTGKETVVFTCFNQDQPLDHVVFPVLRDRLGQNTVQEKLTAQWIGACLREMDAAHP